MRRARFYIRLVAALLVPLTFLACQPKDTSEARTKFRIATFVWVGYAPIHLAKAKGFFAKRGLDVEIRGIDDTGARRSALSSGRIHGSVDIVDSFANAVARGLPAKVVLKLDDSVGGDGILVRRELRSITDLKGRTVAYPEGQPSHFFLLSLLRDAGMSMDDVKSRPMDPDQAGAAFVSQSVDAAVTWEPWLTKAASLPHGRILTTSRDKPGLIADIFTVRSSFLDSNPEAVQAFIEGWLEAVQYWRENPRDANTVMANALNLDLKEFEQMVAGIHYSGPEENRKFFTRNADGSSPFIDLMSRANFIWQAEGVIEKPVAPEAVDGSELLLGVVR